METTGEQLEVRGSWLKLAWVPRQQNEEADALTNGCFESFDPALRVALDVARMPWNVMGDMMEAGGGMIDELARHRTQKRAAKAHSRDGKRSKKNRQDPELLRNKDPW